LEGCHPIAVSADLGRQREDNPKLKGPYQQGKLASVSGSFPPKSVGRGRHALSGVKQNPSKEMIFEGKNLSDFNLSEMSCRRDGIDKYTENILSEISDFVPSS
jgi:hypothetical protein